MLTGNQARQHLQQQRQLQLLRLVLQPAPASSLQQPGVVQVQRAEGRHQVGDLCRRQLWYLVEQHLSCTGTEGQWKQTQDHS